MAAVRCWGGEVPQDDPPARTPHREETHRVVEAIVRLRSPERKDRLRALETIERFPGKAIPFLVKAARSDDRLFRARVANALGLVGGETKDDDGVVVREADRNALFALTVLLKDPDAFVRREALAALVRVGDASHAALIVPLLGDPVDAVQADAVRALAALGPDGAEARMRELLEHGNARVRRTALAVLLEQKVAGLDGRLFGLLQDPDGGVRGDAAAALAERAQADVAKAAAAARDAAARRRVVRTAATDMPEVKKVADALMTLLDDKDPFVVATAIRGLKDLQARVAVPRLVGLLEGQPAMVRGEAISALGALGGRPVAAVLAGQLSVSSSVLRQRAAMALGLMGDEARTAVPALIQLLADKDERVRQKADLALRLILRTRVGYRAGASEEERLEAMRKWQQVWQESKGT
jgi:HEAT repeat protein